MVSAGMSVSNNTMSASNMKGEDSSRLFHSKYKIRSFQTPPLEDDDDDDEWWWWLCFTIWARSLTFKIRSFTCSAISKRGIFNPDVYVHVCYCKSNNRICACVDRFEHKIDRARERGNSVCVCVWGGFKK
jgi:hypothetical protein